MQESHGPLNEDHTGAVVVQFGPVSRPTTAIAPLALLSRLMDTASSSSIL
jgi:hypothetical protein